MLAGEGGPNMDTIETALSARSGTTEAVLRQLPSRLHHNAYVVKDHEANRRFFEDLLGIPLVATWCEKNFSTELQREVEFCHTFFGMADGSALAFFQFADPELYAMTQAERPAKIGRYDHIAFKAEPGTYDELKRRLEAAGEPYRESNHGYCKSIYVTSPDGLYVEFTQDPEDVAEIDAIRRADAHSELARWLDGDRHTNNELRGRQI
jgi:glyoxylase I family protein